MSNTVHAIPMADSPQRADAKGAIYRLAAVAFGHPLPEFQRALEDGSFHEAFNNAWQRITGRQWPRASASTDFTALEAGYIDAFVHGRQGKPRVPLLAGEYEHLLGGKTRPAFMLNVRAFYSHFGLRAATGDEGRPEEPDHLVDMLEFMAVLCHLEARALERRTDPSSYRRAQRDFLQRHLLPLMDAICQGVAAESGLALDATLVRMIEDLPQWARQQLAELQARVGPYSDQSASVTQRPRSVEQNLW
ncbi:MAG: molecular chaperone TorD family protein, partial [Burkholderiales bacterium]